MDDEDFYDLLSDPEIKYNFRLADGGLLIGSIDSFIGDDKLGEGIIVNTLVGKVAIYHNNLIDAYMVEDANRHGHRAYIMPTAKPIGDDHFIGNWQVGLIHGGFGIYDIASISGGVTLLPGTGFQAYFINGKFTVAQDEFDDKIGGYAIALGGVYSSVFHAKLAFAYANASFYGERTTLTGMFFGRVNAAPDVETIKLYDRAFPIFLPQGAMGLGFSMDTKFSRWSNTRFVGELWAPDLTNPLNAAAMGGLRLDNNKVAYDFGVAVLLVPAIVPYFSFSWTPF
ncbi:MAG: hypothetical protein Kapaf2KO_16870 [Candidatus Kapaibacteriales bacterium]